MEDTGLNSSKEPLDIDIELTNEEAIPPCIQKLLNAETPLSHARGKALLAFFFYKIGLDKETAKEKWTELCNAAGGPKTNIFESWWEPRDKNGNIFDLPSCETIQKNGQGYPFLEMGDIGLCDPDETCEKIQNLAGYITDKEIEIEKEKIFDKNKLAWDCETEFVTFTTDIEFEDDKIEWGDTYELPKELAEELVEKKKAAYGIWKCSDCGQIHYQEKKPYECMNADNEDHNKRYKFIPIHPSDDQEIGDTLRKNYEYATPTESMDESKPGILHVYKDGYYENDTAKGITRSKINKIAYGSTQGRSRRVMTYIADCEHIMEEAFGLTGSKVVIKNGILNLETLEVEPHDPDALALSRIDIEFEEEAECPYFKAFLKEIMPDYKDRKRLQEVLGTALVNEKYHKKGIILLGPTDAGKSTL